MYANYTPKDVARFWNKVDKSPHPQGCWLWTACRSKKGYGSILWIGGSRNIEYAHRVSYLLANGSYPDELHVLHDCDNPACVNPEHLFLGTCQDNADDMYSKGRQRKAKREDHGRHILTQEQVDEIRERFSSGKRGIQSRMAKEYGVSVGQIGRIVHGQEWKPD